MHWVKVTRPKGHILILPFDTKDDAYDFAQHMWENPNLGDAVLMTDVLACDAIGMMEDLNNEQ